MIKKTLSLAGIAIVFSLSMYGKNKSKAIQIPPHGKPEKRIKSGLMEAPTAMAFKSKNRPNMMNASNPKSIGYIKTIRGVSKDGGKTWSLAKECDLINACK